MKFAIITGVSKGLGESVAAFLLESHVNIIGISRTENNRLAHLAEESNLIYKHYKCDLGNIERVEATIEGIQKFLFTQDVSLIYVINNAATLEPMDVAMNTKSADLRYHYNVNVITPMLILNSFLDKYGKKSDMVVGVNVTSGAANRPIYGWSAYSSSKASIDAYTKTIALELDQLKTGHKVIAFNPGVMDTGMQEKIRAADEESFIDVETFRSYKKDNILKDSDIVAGVLVDILTDEVTIENGKSYNVNDYV